MKTLRHALMIAFAAGTLAALLAPPSADAQQRPKVKIYAWCLEEARGDLASGQTLCRFDSYEQCLQSKNGGGDRCVRNFYGDRP